MQHEVFACPSDAPAALLPESWVSFRRRRPGWLGELAGAWSGERRLAHPANPRPLTLAAKVATAALTLAACIIRSIIRLFVAQPGRPP
jgi:hypothetical protein